MKDIELMLRKKLFFHLFDHILTQNIKTILETLLKFLIFNLRNLGTYGISIFN